MRVLGVDPGEKRIGLAVSDPLGITAQGLETISAENLAFVYKLIADLCQRYNVEQIVVGNPLNMNGSSGFASQSAIAFAQELQQRLGIPVKMVDERLTSAEAERTLISRGMRRNKRKQVRDKLAAVLILEQYLNSSQNC